MNKIVSYCFILIVSVLFFSSCVVTDDAIVTPVNAHIIYDEWYFYHPSYVPHVGRPLNPIYHPRHITPIEHGRRVQPIRHEPRHDNRVNHNRR